ncbi:MAG: type II toxin-antitoxin system VapC family toxin [Thermodesulfobacteriota bacterium]
MTSTPTCFVDASAWIALYHKRDKYHKQAWKVYENILDKGIRIVTTNWVAYEALSLLKSRASYNAAKSLWDILQNPEFSKFICIDMPLENQEVFFGFWIGYRGTKIRRGYAI